MTPTTGPRHTRSTAQETAARARARQRLFVIATFPRRQVIWVACCGVLRPLPTSRLFFSGGPLPLEDCSLCTLIPMAVLTVTTFSSQE